MSETEKWRDPWFRNLKVHHKALWFWLLDNCDIAGVLKEIDWGLASFQIGEIVSESDMAVFDGRIESISGCWWIKKFCAFQYGWIDDQTTSNVHRSVIKSLARVSISLERVNEGLAKPCSRLKDKDKDKDKDILSIYSEYPKKEAKRAGLKAIEAALERGATVEHLLERTKAYAVAVAAWSVSDKTYIPHPATWFNQGRYDDDPQTWKRNANTSTSTPGSSRHFENADYASRTAF